VDIYLPAGGVIADAKPAISCLAYRETTGQSGLSSGEYWVAVTSRREEEVLITVRPLRWFSWDYRQRMTSMTPRQGASFGPPERNFQLL
jgi:hypothetical protein